MARSEHLSLIVTQKSIQASALERSTPPSTMKLANLLFVTVGIFAFGTLAGEQGDDRYASPRSGMPGIQ